MMGSGHTHEGADLEHGGDSALWIDTDGAQLLDEVERVIKQYVVLPSEESLVATVLWVAATHATNVVEHATRLCIHSPVKRCGKSRLLEIVTGLVHSPVSTTSISVPALFRLIEKAGDDPPTLVLDEADRLFGTKQKDENNADLIALLNNGFRRGAPTYRCVGPRQEPTPFSNFGFVALAGIGHLPDTIEDRGIVVVMRRRLRGEGVDKFRLRTDQPRLQLLRDRLGRWTTANAAEIERNACDGSNMPGELEDRTQDAWEPLIGIACAAGSHWPARARAAAIRLSSEAGEDDAETLDLRLVGDVKTAFDAVPDEPFVSTRNLLTSLRANEEAPWADEGFSPRQLAQRLRKFGVKPQRNSAGNERGYRRTDLEDVFARYLSVDPSDTSETERHQHRSSDATAPADTSTRQTALVRQPKSAAHVPTLTGLTGLTHHPTTGVPVAWCLDRDAASEGGEC